VYNMLNTLRKKEFIRKKIKYLMIRVVDNPRLQDILDEYVLLYKQYQ